MILGAIHLVNAEMNRYRTIAPHETYRYPPPQTRTVRGETLPRLRGETVAADDLREAALAMLTVAQPESTSDTPTTEPKAARRKARRGRQETPTLARLLASQVEGFSRELGREVAARALASPDEPLTAELPWASVATETHTLAALAETSTWEPTLVYADATSEEPTAFAVYLPRQFGEASLRPTASVDEMLATYYHDAEWRLAIDSARSRFTPPATDTARPLRTQGSGAPRRTGRHRRSPGAP